MPFITGLKDQNSLLTLDVNLLKPRVFFMYQKV